MLLTYVSIFYLPLGFCAVSYLSLQLRLTSVRCTWCINGVLAGTLGNPKYNRHKHKNAIHIDSNYCLFIYFSNHIQYGEYCWFYTTRL